MIFDKKTAELKVHLDQIIEIVAGFLPVFIRFYQEMLRHFWKDLAEEHLWNEIFACTYRVENLL